MIRSIIDKTIKNKKLVLILFLFVMPTVVFAKTGNDDITIGMALGMEAFVSIHMSIFVLKPLSKILSKENNKKTFWILFGIRAFFLIFFDFFVTTSIAIIDFILVFVGALIVLPLSAIVNKNSNSNLTTKTTNEPKDGISGIELRCAKCNSILQITDKVCKNCGEVFDGNNVVVSKNENATVLIPPKDAVSPTNFDKMYSLTEDKMLNEFINREFKKAGIDKSSKLIPRDILKRKKILNIIFSVLVFVFISLIFFHFPIYTYIIGLIILFIFFKVTKKYNLNKYLNKEIKARPTEKISNIIMNAKNTFVVDNSKSLFLTSLLLAIVLPLIIFSNPKIIYEKIDNGYAVRYYIYGLTNFKSATIPEEHNNQKVVSLRGNTFSNMPFLESVVLPDSITEIRGQAFKNCKRLVNVNMPKNLEYLGGGAFNNAISIKKIELPDTLTYLGGESFYKARSLETVKLSKNLNEIRGDSFEYCTSLKSITIPDNVERIGAHAFYGDTSLSEVVFTENSKLTEIGSSAFRQCSSLYSITIPSGVYINERAFKESPTNINYFNTNINYFNNLNSNYDDSSYTYNDNYQNIIIPYKSDYLLFNKDRGFLSFNDNNLKLVYSTGILDNNIYYDAYISGALYNPLYLYGKVDIKISFYDNKYNEIATHQDEIELLGKGYSAISFYCGVGIDEFYENKSFDDIYYYKIEFSKLTLN